MFTFALLTTAIRGGSVLAALPLALAVGVASGVAYYLLVFKVLR